jgi:hypothetical protein
MKIQEICERKGKLERHRLQWEIILKWILEKYGWRM